MKIGIIGAGFTGLAASYKLLQHGHAVTIFERDPLPGGLAIGYQENGWDWTLEKHYHHWFTNDKAVLDLAKDLDFPVVIKRPQTSSYVDREILQLDSPMTLLQFAKLSIAERLRMAATLAALRFNPFWKPLEKVKAGEVLPQAMGQKPYEMLWEPLLSNKFGSYAKDISLAWFWARIKKRTTALAYPEGGFLRFAEKLTDAVKKRKGTVHFNTDVLQITAEDSSVRIEYQQNGKKRSETFDRVLVTLPGFLFAKLAPDLPENYQKKLTALKGIGAVNLVVRLKKPFFSDKTYWLSICEKNAPVLAIVEHTNFMDKKHYNNEHLLYLGNYVPMDHKYVAMPVEKIFKDMLPYLKKINPDIEKNVIGLQKFVAPFAQPIIPTNYSKMIPPFQTPLPHVYLANMQQVYPWDRGTNYAVELGEKVADLIIR